MFWYNSLSIFYKLQNWFLYRRGEKKFCEWLWERMVMSLQNYYSKHIDRDEVLLLHWIWAREPGLIPETYQLSQKVYQNSSTWSWFIFSPKTRICQWFLLLTHQELILHHIFLRLRWKQVTAFCVLQGFLNLYPQPIKWNHDLIMILKASCLLSRSSILSQDALK